jgi:hypothetical protein
MYILAHLLTTIPTEIPSTSAHSLRTTTSPPSRSTKSSTTASSSRPTPRLKATRTGYSQYAERRLERRGLAQALPIRQSEAGREAQAGTVIDLLGKVIAGRLGSYKRWFGREGELARGIIQRHDDAYSELKANSAESKMRGCLAYSSRNMEERLERLLRCSLKSSPLILFGIGEPEHGLR